MIDPHNRGFINAYELVRTVYITSVITLKLMAKEKLPSEYALNC